MTRISQQFEIFYVKLTFPYQCNLYDKPPAMKCKGLLLSLFFSVLLLPASAQDKSKAKFGNVTAADFATKMYSIDSNANAVVIADIGSSSIDGNSKGWFSLVYKRFKRVHILNKNAYDMANISIPLYAEGNAEELLEKVKAVTYNLEDGKVVETKLNTKDGIFKDKINKNLVVKKFTFPNVKEGSIIEYEYTIVSDYLRNLQPWEFQGSYPRLWSEYNLSLPSFFNYVFLTQGYLNYDINTRKSGTTVYNVISSEGTERSERYRIDANITDYRWVIKDVPALKEESFTTTVNNYISKIEFQLSEYRPPLQYRSFLGTWGKLSEDLMNAEYFGEPLTKDNKWLDEITEPLAKGGASKLEKAKNIYAWVRDNITCTDHEDVYMNQGLKNIIKTKNGSVSEVNLLLAAMLRHEGIETDPVLLSTRSHGFIYPLYPLMSRFNYVICKTSIDGKEYFLDASEPRLGFGTLPVRCYNGTARVINKIGTAVELTADSLKERKNSTVFIINDEKGNMVGSMQQSPGKYESFSLRNRIKEKGKEELVKEIKRDFGLAVEISNPKFDSLDKYEENLGISYDFDIKEEKEDIIYLNPMFGEGYKDNPFKSAERYYPVEMPYTIDETYNLQMEVPEGYLVDELPKQVMVKMNEQGDGQFEYRITQSGTSISMRSRLQIKRALFMPEEYEMLREFFAFVVKKHGEQIVFKKKK